MIRACVSLAVLAVFAVGILVAVPPATQAEETWGFDPRFDPGDVDELLVKGTPPLKRGDLERFEDLLEAAFDMAVPPAPAQRVRDALEAGWPKAEEGARRAFLALVEPWESLRGLAHLGDRQAVDKGLVQFRRGLDAWLGTQKESPAAREVRDLLRRRLQTAWPGTPPIHDLAAEAWLDLVDFIVSLGRNEDVKLTTGRRSVIRDDVGKAFKALDEKTRQQILDAHRGWLRVQESWARGTAKDHLMLRFSALETLIEALPKEMRITLGTKADLVSYARSATLLRSLQSAYDAFSNLSRHPDLVLGTIEPWLSRDGAPKRPRPLLR